jgi:septal ring factor EnvC (AmiA/AmiB activator)
VRYRLAALRILAACALVLSLLLQAAEPADAPDESRRLDAVEAALKNAQARAADLASQADSTAAEIARLQALMVDAAGKAQESETSLSSLEEELARLEKSEAATRADLVSEHARLSATLAALQRLSMQPREALILRPGAPIDAVRSAMLLRLIIPTLTERATGLRLQLERLRDLRAEIAARRGEQASGLASLRGENGRIAALLEKMQALQQSTEAERAATTKRMSDLAAQAKDLRALLADIEKQQAAMLATPAVKPAAPEQTAMVQPPAPEAAPPAATNAALATRIRIFPKDAKGIVAPARGILVTRYGTVGDAGYKTRGIELQTRPGARVVAPFDGQVVFRGPFRGYGEILIIEHRGGYHTLLAGLGRTDVTVGQWLLAGEPVGIMGPPDSGNPKLYVELRRGGNPINPAPWLGLRDK